MGQTVHIDGVGSLLGLVGYVHALLAGDQVDQLVTVLADDHRPGEQLFSKLIIIEIDYTIAAFSVIVKSSRIFV